MTRSVILWTSFALALAAGGLHADTYRLEPRTFFTSLSVAHQPALTLKSGDRVVTRTVAETDSKSDRDVVGKGAFPLTGPFYVEGAQPGDLLVVTIDKLVPNRSTGWSTSQIAAGAIPAGGLEGKPDPTRFSWTIDKAAGVVRLDLSRAIPNTDWRERFVAPSFDLPLSPVLGAIGVAPATGDPAEADAAGPFGGNMVSTGISTGARVMLPVSQPGALLFIGHGQARKGDGAITGSGVETSLDVEFSVTVVKKREWPHSSVVRPSTVVGEFAQGWPRIETDEYLMAVGSASILADALQRSTLELHHWLDDDFGLSEKTVSLLMGQSLEYEVANITDAACTVVAKIRKAYLPKAAGL